METEQSLLRANRTIEKRHYFKYKHLECTPRLLFTKVLLYSVRTLFLLTGPPGTGEECMTILLLFLPSAGFTSVDQPVYLQLNF